MMNSKTLTLYIRTYKTVDLPELDDGVIRCGDTLAQGRLYTEDRALDVAVNDVFDMESEDQLLGRILLAFGRGFLGRAEGGAN